MEAEPAGQSAPLRTPAAQDQEEFSFGNHSGEPLLLVPGLACPAVVSTSRDEPSPQYEATSPSTTGVTATSAISRLDATSLLVPAESCAAVVCASPAPPVEPLMRDQNPSCPPRTADDDSATPEPSATSRRTSALPSEWKVWTSPDEHSIIDDALLRCTPYTVNKKYTTLICTDCGYCPNPDHAVEHLRKKHGHCKVGADFTEQLNAKFPDLVAEVMHPLEVVRPVFGLAVSNDRYTICARCYRGYRNLESWRHHTCGRKNLDLEGRPQYFTSFVQTFFRGQKIGYFPVELPVSVSDEAASDDFGLFKLGFQDLPISEDIIDEPEDYRELNQFLAKEGWINHVSGNSRSELSLLTAPPNEEEILKPIVARDITAVMFNIQAAIGTAGYHVRRLLGKRPA